MRSWPARRSAPVILCHPLMFFTVLVKPRLGLAVEGVAKVKGSLLWPVLRPQGLIQDSVISLVQNPTDKGGKMALAPSFSNGSLAGMDGGPFSSPTSPSWDVLLSGFSSLTSLSTGPTHQSQLNKWIINKQTVASGVHFSENSSKWHF